MRLATVAVAAALTVGLPALCAARPSKTRKNDPIPVVRIPAAAVPSPNAYETYEEAYAQVQNHGYEFAEANVSDGSQQAIVVQNGNAIALVLEANQQVFEAPPMRSLLVPNLDSFAHVRSLARLLRFESDWEAAGGDWHEAAQTALEIVRMGVNVQHDGGLIPSLVGLSVEAIGRSALRPALPHLSGPESLSVAVQIRAAEVAKPSYADVLLQEKYFSEAALVEMMRNTNDWRQAKRETYPSGSAPSNQEIMDDCRSYFTYAIREAKRPWPQAKPFFPPGNSILTNIVAFDTRFVFAKDRAENELIAGQALLQSYRSAHGAYPQTLAAALAENRIVGELDDPFAASGHLRYRRSGDDYVLYSVGPDGIDDGGTPIDNSKAGDDPQLRRAVHHDSRGDIVAGVNS